MSIHLFPQEAESLVTRGLPRRVEISHFQHWRQCPLCRSTIAKFSGAAGFLRKPARPEKLLHVAVHADIDFNIYCTPTEIAATAFGTTDSIVVAQWKGFPVISPREEDCPNVIKQLIRAIRLYISCGKPLRRTSVNPLFITTEFLQKVLFWTRLIPHGTTVTYGDIATWIDNPQAARAVGGALHRNPLPLIIPCHRVIGTNGDLTGFSGGLQLKKFLLKLEKRE